MSAAYGPHCCLARLCLRASSRTTVESSMGSLHEPQTSSEAKTPLRYAPLKKLRMALHTFFQPEGRCFCHHDGFVLEQNRTGLLAPLSICLVNKLEFSELPLSIANHHTSSWQCSRHR